MKKWLKKAENSAFKRALEEAEKTVYILRNYESPDNGPLQLRESVQALSKWAHELNAYGNCVKEINACRATK